MRLQDLGISVGSLERGPHNAITDVPGVLVGHSTIIKDQSIRTGVTAILPHGGNIFQEKVPAAVCVFNAFGKLAGALQVEELGCLETPIILTNTLAVGTAIKALVEYTLSQPGNEEVRSVNAVVGETNDGYLNDIRGLHITEQDVWQAIKCASAGPVEEGAVGAGTGTVAFGFKGGIGTSSRIVPYGNGEYVVGVLVQTNFGRVLKILGHTFTSGLFQKSIPDKKDDGSCMIVIATNAPLTPRMLKRVARRAFAGMARTTTVMSTGSGDFAIAFSTAYRIPHAAGDYLSLPHMIPDRRLTIFFQAVEEATQEAIYNSILMAGDMEGYQGHKVRAFPIEKLKEIISNRR